MRKKALIIEAAGKGRVCHSTFHMCRALHWREMDVTLLTTRDYELDRLPAEFEVIKLFPDKSCFVFPLYFCSIIRRVREIKPDVIHFQWFPSAILGIFLINLLRMFTDAKIVYTPHNILPHKNRFRYAWAWARIYKSVDSVIVHSEYYKTVLSDIFEVPGARIFVLSDAILLGSAAENMDPHESRRMLDLPHDGNIILFFGYMNREKGIDTLLEAFAVLKKEVPGAALALAGEPSGDLAYQEELWDKKAVFKGVFMDLRYIPFDTMLRYFSAADVVALPYLKVCQSPLVSMARTFKKPVVTTDLTWTGSDDGVFIVQPGDVNGLKEALRKAVESVKQTGSRRDEDNPKKNPSWKPVIETLNAAYALNA